MLAVARERLGDRARSSSAGPRSCPSRRRLVRPPHVHVPPPLRGRPGDDARGARARRAPGRHDRLARVRRPRAARRRCVGALRPRRPCRSRERLSATAGTRSAASSAGRSAPSGPATRSSGSSSGGARPACRTSRRGGSRSAEASSSGDGGVTAPPEARPAFYALERGGWRDYVTLLHPPYTAWHVSYVVIGGCLAPVVVWGRLGAAAVAFALAVGVGAHALDELNGRPLRTAIPRLGARRPGLRLDRGGVCDRPRGGGDVRAVAGPARRRWASSSSSPTTSSSAAGASTPISGSASRGAAFRLICGYAAVAGGSMPQPCSPRRSPSSSRSRSACSPATSVTSGARRGGPGRARAGRRRDRGDRRRVPDRPGRAGPAPADGCDRRARCGAGRVPPLAV